MLKAIATPSAWCLQVLLHQRPHRTFGLGATHTPLERAHSGQKGERSVELRGPRGVGTSMAGVRGRTKPYLFEGPDSEQHPVISSNSGCMASKAERACRTRNAPRGTAEERLLQQALRIEPPPLEAKKGGGSPGSSEPPSGGPASSSPRRSKQLDWSLKTLAI